MLRSVILSTATLVLAAQTPAPEAPKATPAAASTAKAAKAPKAPAAKAAPTAAPAKPAADPVLATVGKEIIRQSDFERFLNTTLSDQQRMQLQFIEGAREQYLTRFLEFKALAAKARKEGFEKQPEHAKKLAIMDMQLLIQALMERDGPALQARLTLKDEEVKAFFDKHPDKFKTPEMFTARHILIGTSAKGDEKALTDEQAKAKADKVLAEIKGGKAFDAAAKEYSDDPGSKDKGGLYENTPFGRFDPTFEKAVRGQELGKVGEPVKTGFGYHLIQAEKITPAVPMTFEAAKDSARQQASAERLEAVMTAYMDAAKKETGYHEGPKAPAAGKARKGAK